ncbi:MAG TPA: hypothetical protein VFZ77_04665 [Acidimicrobiales bacterium]
MGSPTTTTSVPPAPGDRGEGPAQRGRRRRRLAVIAAVCAVLALATAASLAWLTGDGGDDDAPPDEAPTTLAPPTAPATEPGTQGAGTTAVPADEPGATAVLAPFFSAAATMDEQLRAAAAAINGTGPPWDAVSEDVAAAVRAADRAAVAATIPAGLPDDLLQAVILAYSDLASRRAAMQSFASSGTPFASTDELLAELGNGHEAAARFDDDLAAARSLAASTPPVQVAPPDSREAAEQLLLVQYVDKANAGCDSRGGAVVTELPPITWESDDGGTIGAPPIAFEAALGPGGYRVEIIAC